MTSKYKIQTPRMIWQNCKEGVHSLCQNKNAHSLGLSYLKRLQFHTMFDVYGHFVDWILIFLQTLYTNIYPANNIYIYVISKRNKWGNFFVYFKYFLVHIHIKRFIKGHYKPISIGMFQNSYINFQFYGIWYIQYFLVGKLFCRVNCH